MKNNKTPPSTRQTGLGGGKIYPPVTSAPSASQLVSILFSHRLALSVTPLRHHLLSI